MKRSVNELIDFNEEKTVVTSTHESYKYLRFQFMIFAIKLLKNKSKAEQNSNDFVQFIKAQHGERTKLVR